MEDQFESELDHFDDEGYAFHHHMTLLRQQLQEHMDLLCIPEVVVPHEVFEKLGTEYGVDNA